MQMMVDKGAFWIPQVWADEVYIKQGLQKAKDVVVGTDTSMKLAKKYGTKIAFGTDLMFDLENRKTALQELVARKKYFSSAEIMIQATGNTKKGVGSPIAHTPDSPNGAIVGHP